MHAIFQLYSRAYLTAALQELPPEQRGYQHADLEAVDAAQPSSSAAARLFARLAGWLRTEWEELREEQRKSPLEQIYWPPDI